MTKKVEERLKAVAGLEGRGWQKAAAERLGVSDKTVREALKGGAIPAKLEARLVDFERGAQEVSADEWAPLAQQAGRWVFGSPETRSGERDVVAEVLLTHMATPYFVVHLTMKAGKTAHGGPIFERRARFFEEPSSPERRAQLLKLAFEKAEARLYADAQAGAVAVARKRMLDQIAKDARNDLDISDAHTAGLEELARAVRIRSQAELDAERRRLERELADLHNEQREQEARSPEPRAIARAWRDAQRAGGVRVMLQFAAMSDAYLDCTVAQLVFAKHERLLPEAHLTSARGASRRAEAPDMDQVDAELAEMSRAIGDEFFFQRGEVWRHSAG